MIIDCILAVFAGVATQSALVFWVLITFAALFIRTDRPFSSGLLKLAWMALGISALFSLFGGGGDGGDGDL